LGLSKIILYLPPGVANVELSDEIAKSQLATSWQPAAVATPPTSAITGFEQFMINCIKDEHKLKRLLKYASPGIFVLSSISYFLLNYVQRKKHPQWAAINTTFTESSKDALF
jgi:hypothetical protein